MFDNDAYKQFATVRAVQPRQITLHVFGDVDMSSAPELIEDINDAAKLLERDSLLIVNLSKCRYFDSSGLGALIHARKFLGARLTIVVMSHSHITRVMHIVGFDKLLNVVTELPTDTILGADDVVLGSA